MNKSCLILNSILAVFLIANASATKESVNNRNARVFKSDELPFQNVDIIGRIEAANPDGYGVSVTGGSSLSNVKAGERLFIPKAVLNGKSLTNQQKIIITQVTNENQNTPFGSMKVVTGVDLQKVIKELGAGLLHEIFLIKQLSSRQQI